MFSTFPDSNTAPLECFLVINLHDAVNCFVWRNRAGQFRYPKSNYYSALASKTFEIRQVRHR